MCSCPLTYLPSTCLDRFEPWGSFRSLGDRVSKEIPASRIYWPNKLAQDSYGKYHHVRKLFFHAAEGVSQPVAPPTYPEADRHIFAIFSVLAENPSKLFSYTSTYVVRRRCSHHGRAEQRTRGRCRNIHNENRTATSPTSNTLIRRTTATLNPG
jgi:hypothetical protein